MVTIGRIVVIIIAIMVIGVVVVVLLVFPVQHAFALFEVGCDMIDSVLSGFKAVRAETAPARKSSL
jgi:hypothetical protein